MLGMSALFSAFTLLPETKHEAGDMEIDNGGITVRQIQLQKDINQPKATAAQKTPKQVQQFTKDFITVKDTEQSTEFNNIEKLAIGGQTEITGTPGGIEDLPPVEAPGSGDVPETTAAPIVDMNEPVDNPDVQASYPGGNLELRRFLERNLQAPEEAGEEVQVKVRFVVGFDGNLESFDIVQDGGIDYNKEVIRVLKKMPKWNPGKKGGRNVRVYYYLPVKFQPLD